jgi:hypothetical protein
MIAGSASWSRPASARRRLALAGAVGAVAFVAAWGLLHTGFWSGFQIRDTALYQQFGNAIADGYVPYRDFGLEYPPGALPVFWLPTIGHARGDARFYEGEFEALMAVCGIGCVFAMTSILRSVGARRRRIVLALGLFALLPLALGTVILSRFDLWPALLVLTSLALLLRGRLRRGHAVLGLAIATKLFPAVLLPLTVAYAWRTRGRREALLCLGVVVGVCAVVVVPFAALAPAGVWHSLTVQADRPLQIESLGSSILLALHQAAGLKLAWDTSHGSQNLRGSAPDALAALSTAIEVIVLVVLSVAFARGPADRERLVRYSAAVLVAFVALGKVLSPQFMIWLLPVLPLVAGRRGAVAAAGLLVACILTQLWFPSRYWELVLPPPGFGALVSWLVFARDVVLVVVLIVLSAPGSPRARESIGRTGNDGRGRDRDA